MAAPPDAGAAAKLSSYLSRLNPVPGFPEYTGPYKVGTVDVEIPVTDLSSPSPAPPNAAGIHTVQFRIFYPATADSAGKRITWLPSPQRNHISAYTKFLGLGPVLSEVVSFLPRHLNYTTIPVHKNASLLELDAPNKQWPSMIFSHGLGGNRNAYSHVVGSLASHGVVVICPEHRDGSSAVSFIRDPAAQDRFFKRSTRSEVPYVRIPHTETAEVWDARNQQLKIRMWELGLLHEAVLAIQEDSPFKNMNASTPKALLEQFKGRLNVEGPGSIIWGGHSFGAASIVQFLKSTYYADDAGVASLPDPLFTPSPTSRIRAQITEKSATILLDMWCFPLLAASTRRLWELPLPVYGDKPSAAGGKALMAIESEAFFKWTSHLHTTAKILSPEPSAPIITSAAFERPSGVRLPEPNLFYVQNSAHLNQSDFGLLFPWLTRKVFGAEEPERALRLNVRAILQMLRANDVPVARTWVGDLVDGAHVDKLDVGEGAGSKGPKDGIDDDKAIFERSGEGRIEAWRWIDIVGLGAKAGELQTLEGAREGTEDVKEAENGEELMEGEIEPHLSPQTSGTMAPGASTVNASA